MVVDGRNRMAEGMNLHELARVLRWLGAKEAMNLDGGGSSTLYVKGATENNVVNHPSDNKRFDHEGLREVARSEEHTSELQSLMRISYAVFCLKKNKKSKSRT